MLWARVGVKAASTYSAMTVQAAAWGCWLAAWVLLSGPLPFLSGCQTGNFVSEMFFL